MTAPIYGNDPTIAKLASVERRMSRIEYRIGGIGIPQVLWTAPALLNDCMDVGDPFPAFGWRVGTGAGIVFRGRLSVPSSASSGVVAFEIPVATDSHGTPLAAFAHDFEVPAIVDVDGTRTAASYSFDSATGEVTVYTIA